MCELCNGTRVVHTEIMTGVINVTPCPNCTNVVHQHYEQEFNNIRNMLVESK
ncbi:hypothetical protein [Lactobacillus plantarum] [Lactiplantibacillus mudanjiangensis]|nr:hypothetical protein [Lactobacillus plantarum] [Lactiplantibacillus mudanjiangensis]